MKKIYGLIFDVDGVIADSETVNTIASIQVFEDLFNIYNVKKEDFEAGLGRGAAEYMKAAARIHGLDLKGDDLNASVDARQENFLNILKANPIPAYPGVMELIESAMTSELFLTAIATSSTREKSKAVLDSAGIPYQKMVYITGSDVKRKKPNPELFLTAASKLGINPENCLVIEDAPDGVQAAHAAGCKCVAVTNSTTAKKLQEAEMIVKSLTELDLDKLIGIIKSNE